MKKIKYITLSLLSLLVLLVGIAGFWLYRFASPSEILTASDGSQYVDFKPAFAASAARCIPDGLPITLEKETFVLDGYQRSYYYYEPKSYRKSSPLVFVIHGSGMDGAAMRSATYGEFDRLADEHGFVVIYPNGFDGGWNDLRKKSPHTAKRLNLDDIGYFRHILDREEARRAIDRNNVFFFGLSNGGQMMLRLLVQAPEMVSAATLVGANLPVESNSVSTYNDLHRTPVMFVHGTEDFIVPYKGGEVRLFYVMNFGEVHSTADSVAHWVDAAGHHYKPSARQIDTADDGTSIDLLRWSAPGKDEVRLYTVNGGGHTIPMPPMRKKCGGFDGVSHDMNTVTEAWSFFRESIADLK